MTGLTESNVGLLLIRLGPPGPLDRSRDPHGHDCRFLVRGGCGVNVYGVRVSFIHGPEKSLLEVSGRRWMLSETR